MRAVKYICKEKKEKGKRKKNNFFVLRKERKNGKDEKKKELNNMKAGGSPSNGPFQILPLSTEASQNRNYPKEKSHFYNRNFSTIVFLFFSVRKKEKKEKKQKQRKIKNMNT